MSCFGIEKKIVTPKKTWKHLASTVQKKLDSFETSKPFNKINKYILRRHLSSSIPRLRHHHHLHCHHCSTHQTLPELVEFRLETLPYPIEGIEKSPAKELLAPIKITLQEGYNNNIAKEEEDNCDGDHAGGNGDTGTSSESICIDAIAEEFIRGMKERWRLERQESYENFLKYACFGTSNESICIDAIAEEFIRGMKERWRLERQESYENFLKYACFGTSNESIRIDAIAEEFIRGMKERWRLERQEII